MKRFVEGADRRQVTLLPPCLDDYVAEENPVRVVEVFVNELDLGALGFAGVVPEVTGRPSYHPATMLKLYLYGYLNRIQSSRRLEREAGRNLELMWLTGRLAPDFKTQMSSRPVAELVSGEMPWSTRETRRLSRSPRSAAASSACSIAALRRSRRAPTRARCFSIRASIVAVSRSR